ncbi:MAG: hypothetical protein QOE58_65 [Actinomycetota bacterium]|nr:hypothetical protein [Actinomycetota bacterium]
MDAIPATTDLALPRGHRRPVAHGVTWHLFDVGTFEVGRSEILIDGTDYPVGLCSAPRSIVDAFRLRSFEGYEIAIEALRAWLGRRGSHPGELMAIATQLPRAAGPVRTALEYLS